MSSSPRPLNPMKRASLFSGSSRRSKARQSKDHRGSAAKFGDAAAVIFGDFPKQNPKIKSELLPTRVFVFLHRRAETEIGSDQTQVHSVTEEVFGGVEGRICVVDSHSYCSGEIHQSRRHGVLFMG